MSDDPTHLDEMANEVNKSRNATVIMRQYKGTLLNNENIICMAFHQGKVFKRFKYKEKIAKMVREFKIRKSTIIFN